jgi:hypothetical protein
MPKTLLSEIVLNSTKYVVSKNRSNILNILFFLIKTDFACRRDDTKSETLIDHLCKNE